MNITKKILLALVLLTAAGLIVLALWPSPVSVNAVQAMRGHFVEYVEEEGRTALRDPYVISAPIAGYLRRVTLEAGDAVEAGDVLLQLEPSPSPALDARTRRRAVAEVRAAEARLAGAEAELETQQADARHAEREYERVRELQAQEAVPATEVDQARRELDRVRGSVRRAQAGVEAARYELRNAEAVLEVIDGQRGEESLLQLRAPAGGLVLRRHRWSEGTVPPGEPLLEIGNLSDLEVQVDLLSMDAVRVTKGMSVILTRWGGDRDLAARVRRVEPAGFTRISALGVEEQRVPVLVSLEAPREEWGPLGEGYRVEARFILWEGEDVLQIPTSALFRQEGGWAVYVIENNRATLRRVEPGRRSGLQTQILAGLDAGEAVITHPGDRIADGVRVTER